MASEPGKGSSFSIYLPRADEVTPSAIMGASVPAICTAIGPGSPPHLFGALIGEATHVPVQVIQYRRYPQPMNLRAKQVIEKVGGTFLGIVLNNINMSQDESYYYYSGYYQDYYQSNNAEDQEAAAPKRPEDSDQGGIKQKY